MILTGQHPQLDPADFGLEVFSPLRLNCAGQENPHAHVGAVTRAVLPLLGSAALLIVQGDTSTALGGALAAQVAGVPVGHVEAGLRSHDRRRPWPEEEFRIAIDSEAELLFAPTELSAANLRRERVRGRIHVTGNTGIDAALRMRSAQALPRRRKAGPLRLLVTCHRRESWGEGLVGIAGALRTLAQERIAAIHLILHPNPAVAAQMQLLLAGECGIRLRGPCSHSDLIQAMLDSDLVLSDSGGLQEEAAALRVPLLILRDATERPEAIACGAIALAGTAPESIVAAVRQKQRHPVARPHREIPYGDGRAAERIAAIISGWMAERDAAPAVRPQMEPALFFQSA